MMQRVVWIGSMAALVLALGVFCFADDDPVEEPTQEPGPLAELREEHLLEETTPVDPLEYLRSFREWIEQHEVAPPRTAKDDTLYSVWSSVLKPRAARMTRRIDTLLKRVYWLPEVGTPERVNPKYWPRFTREIAALNAELIGAYRQYANVKLEDRRVKRVRRSFWGYQGYGYPVSRWRGAVLGRQAVVTGSGASEMYSYWNLMNVYQRGWRWRTRECHECEIHRRKLQEKLNEDIAEKRRLLETTRDTLQEQQLSLQLLAAAMQATEEHALRGQIEEMTEDHILYRPASDLMLVLRDARLEAERYQGDSTARYGQLLRGWLRTYNAGSALLEKEAAKAETDEDDGHDR